MPAPAAAARVGHSGRVNPLLPPLLSCARDIERHVAAAGWDQPARLFALVPTAQLRAAQPHLAQLSEEDDDALSAIEQEDLPPADSVETLLAQLAWPPEVDGIALAVERIVLPPQAQADLPRTDAEALAAVAQHPDRQDVRLLVAVRRDGSATCLLRQRAHDSDDQVAVGQDIAPGLVEALSATLQD
ncbi:hypothetical protein KILIM_058_00110 [Kineosphaera limosa NBRC 100340]|uniref:Uncharacterized protein n=1 Tax=Kineosphaera limosa NBRC 100340 TaxID=1184609 RepID=K6XEA5_9MICO|nr:hypothetical protein KILIM_058_00110 [Kineosphaera limosa NBRC 100340]